MANEEHLELLKQGVTQWNEWREQNPDVEPDLNNADLDDAYLVDADLGSADLENANLSGADLKGANLIQAYLGSANLRSANLSSAYLSRIYLSGADLSQANLSGANLRGANLIGANLSGASLVFTYLREGNLSGAELSHANLSTARVIYANLSGADLSGADLSEAVLVWSDLSGANLRGANLSGSQLGHTDLSRADLSATNLSNSHLNGTDLSGANLNEANLSLAKMGDTIIASLDLRTTKGLAEIEHRGPSHVEPYSILLPQDQTALHFLRGVGVPDEWVDFWRATMMHPIQYHSLFISYSSQDQVFTEKLHSDLQSNGVRCWFAPEDMKIGDKIRSRIDEAIHLQDKLLLILSTASVASDWVEHEVEAALAKERKEKRIMLFPIRVDRAILDQEDHGWPALVRHQRHIGDFSNWTDPQAYQIAFDRFLRDLKKNG